MEKTGSENGGRVLLVDDDPQLLLVLSEELKCGGYLVTQTSDPRRAFEMLETQTFDVVLADQNMPGVTGVQLLAKLREVQPFCARILISGLASSEVLSSAINVGGVDGFVPKPWGRVALLDIVGAAVRRSVAAQFQEKRLAEVLRVNDSLASMNTNLLEQLNALLAKQAPGSEEAARYPRADERSIGLCFRLLSTFSPLLGRQAQAVVEACRVIAGTGYFSDAQRRVLMTSAWIYDIGLIALGKELLRRSLLGSGECSDREMEIIAHHPVIGQVVAAFVDPDHEVGITVRAHHERFDGAGYPDRLAADSIPWTARCLAVAVGFVHSGLSNAEAVEYLLQESGSAFDPEAVRLFVRSMRLSVLPPNVKEALMGELQPGMRLARGIASTAGILLVPEGHEFSTASIAKLQSHAAQHLVTEQLLVYA
jgi:response regulator RpfG family c-di-GMP phosphodiesterase